MSYVFLDEEIGWLEEDNGGEIVKGQKRNHAFSVNDIYIIFESYTWRGSSVKF